MPESKKRPTIRMKKVAVIRMLVDSMEKTVKKMNTDLEKHSSEVSNALLDAHFESLRVRSGNLNLVLENERSTLSILYKSTMMAKQVPKAKGQMPF